MRVAPERVRACLAAGWMVLMTGSKFFGGPPFAGALLTPAEIVARAPELAPLPVGLAGYFSRAEWPRALQHLTACLPQTTNLGLVLRWQAALWEMRAFQAVPREQRSLIMTEAGRAIRGALDGARWLRALAVATSGGEWPQTIFPFEVLRPTADGGAQPMESAALKQVHRCLNADVSSWLPPGALCSAQRLAALPCHVDQPVGIGRTAVLRVCIGAHLVWQTAFDASLGSSLEARLEAQIQRARLLVRKAELIAPQYYDALCAAAGAVAPTRSAWALQPARASAVDPGQAADVPADHQVLDAGAERSKVRRLEVHIEGRLVFVDLVQHHPVRLLAVERDVELMAARLLGYGLAGVGPGQLEELLELVRLDLEFGDDHERTAVRVRASHEVPPGE
jgi:hypothetical protein